MSEHPILFSAPMVRAILAGKKTQTRLVVKPQPVYVESRGAWRWDSPKALAQWTGDRPESAALVGMRGNCPYGAPGDVLWVRETWAREDLGPEEYPRLVWAADRAARWQSSETCFSDVFYLASDYEPARWRPSIHMPRWASRLTLLVKDVRVQRLQEISEEDAKAEGIGPLRADGRMENGLPAYDGFTDLWDSINGKRAPWESNPWVWAVTFERVVEAPKQ